jgi:hypothetical protein
MSYCRFNDVDSDVYVIEGFKGLWCVNCGYSKKGTYVTKSHKQMINHLRMHRRMGNKVPDRAMERLRRELRLGYKPGDVLLEEEK